MQHTNVSTVKSIEQVFTLMQLPNLAFSAEKHVEIWMLFVRKVLLCSSICQW